MLEDQEIGARRGDRRFERLDQPALTQSPAPGQLVAHGNSLAGDGRRKDEVHVGKEDAALDIWIFHLGQRQPARPVLGVAEMEQVGAQDVGGFGKAADLVEQRRAAERREGNFAQQFHRPVRPVADTEGDEGIGLRIADVVEPPRR